MHLTIQAKRQAKKYRYFNKQAWYELKVLTVFTICLIESQHAITLIAIDKIYASAIVFTRIW